MALRPNEQKSRRVMDYLGVHAISGDLIAVQAFRSPRDGTPLTDEEGRNGETRVVIAEYKFPTLVGPDSLRAGARVRFDCTDPEYPFRPPHVQVVGWVPWLPHIQKASGMVCIGASWRQRRGQYLLAHLVLHVGELLNANEPSTVDAYDRDTVRYLQSAYDGGPINRGLHLPAVPPELLCGTIEDSFALARDQRTATVPGFRIASAPKGTFRRIRSGRSE